MDFAAIPLFNIMKNKLNYLSERQSILAQNVANVDTPGYKAQDVEAPDFQKMLRDVSHGPARHLSIATTSARHIMPVMVSPAALKVVDRATTDEMNPNGNNVVVEEEMSKVASNQAEYTKVLNLYGKAISMFKTAIGSSAGG
jgi:flagellar basal-body rod protein FlgB